MRKEIPQYFGYLKSLKLQMDGWNGSIVKPYNNLMIFTIPFFQTIKELSISVIIGFDRFSDMTSNIPPKTTTFEGTGHCLGLQYINISSN